MTRLERSLGQSVKATERSRLEQSGAPSLSSHALASQAQPSRLGLAVPGMTLPSDAPHHPLSTLGMPDGSSAPIGGAVGASFGSGAVDPFYERMLQSLHSVWHLSLSLHPVSSEFDMTADYLQSLMLLVALVLAIGFAVLVGLALYLCVVISFASPVVWPSWSFRLLVSAVAVALVAVGSRSVEGSVAMADGLRTLTRSLEQLSATMRSMLSRQPRTAQAARELNATLAPLLGCLGCSHLNATSPWVNTTRDACELLHAGTLSVITCP